MTVSSSVTDAPGDSRMDRGSAWLEPYAPVAAAGNGTLVPCKVG